MERHDLPVSEDGDERGVVGKTDGAATDERAGARKGKPPALVVILDFSPD